MNKKKKIIKALSTVALTIIGVVIIIVVYNNLKQNDLTKQQLKVIKKVIEVAEGYNNLDITKDEAKQKIDILYDRFKSLPCKTSENSTEQLHYEIKTTCAGADILGLSIDILLDKDIEDDISDLKRY